MRRITWINLILGIWLIISPFALGHASDNAVTTNNIIFGVLLAICSVWILAAMNAAIGVNWFQVLCSIWIIVSPFALGFQRMSRAVGNNVIVGIIALIVGLIEARALASRPAAA